MEIIKATIQGKSFHGHKAETVIKDIKNNTWNLVTMKRHSGNLVSTAQMLEEHTDDKTTGVMISVFSHDSKRKHLINVKVRVTAKAVATQHAKALTMFEEQDKEENKEETK